MREIKFRAWDKETKSMIYNPLGFPELYPTNELMQYTGLKDKNGQEIYEGDILNSKNNGSDGCDVWDYQDFVNLIVMWDNKICCFTGLPDTYNGNKSVHNIKRIEIIGNIHENHELLKENPWGTEAQSHQD